MAQVASLDPTLIPNRIANELPLPLIQELHSEATEIKNAESALHMRRVVLVTRLRENGMSWDSCGWFFGATGEAIRKFYGSLVGDRATASGPDRRGKPDSEEGGVKGQGS